jgi:hypothetical protein
MYQRILAQLSPATWLVLGFLAIIAGKLIDFSLLMVTGATAIVLGIHQVWKAAQQAE